MPKNKSKGSNVERELFKKFVENDYRAVRVAGSGRMENADCDLIAGKKGSRKFAVEVKSSRKLYIYISKDQIKNFETFSDLFGLRPVIALKFFREDWIFVSVSHLRDAGKNMAITLEEAKKKGKTFSDFFT